MSTTTRLLPERYRDVERLTRGAMGDIYRATDSVLGRVVAVKVLSEPFVENEQSRRRFTREALAAARVSSHPNITTIYDVGDSDEPPFIVMEYIDGPSLERHLQEGGRPSQEDVLRWLDEASSALDYAHEQGVVHRDVKPGNLLLASDGSIRVADFGIASAAWLPSLTVEGTVLGTAGYIAPEQATGEQSSPASDRYALGVVAYELLTGDRPFARESPTAEAAAHVSEPVPSVGEPHQDRVFERALAKKPEDRFETCAAFVEALRHALDGSTAPTRVLPAAARPRTARWPIVAAALGTALVVAVLVGVALSGSSGSPPDRVPTQRTPSVSAPVQSTPVVAPKPTPPKHEKKHDKKHENKHKGHH
jgi:eukaryotic-like serine/threonine-protein kinase